MIKVSECGITFEVNRIQRKVTPFSHTILTQGMQWSACYWLLTTFKLCSWTKKLHKKCLKCVENKLSSFFQALLGVSHCSFKVWIGLLYWVLGWNSISLRKYISHLITNTMLRPVAMETAWQSDEVYPLTKQPSEDDFTQPSSVVWWRLQAITGDGPATQFQVRLFNFHRHLLTSCGSTTSTIT